MTFQVWTNGFWAVTTLRALGLRVRVGHEDHAQCPHPRDRVKNFTVLHMTGIHVVDLQFCGCTGAPAKHVQLLRSHWWPATTHSPHTAATMELLRTFRIINLQARANATDFYRSLEYLTHENRLDEAQVSKPLFCA
jgi:hypothetical protein